MKSQLSSSFEELISVENLLDAWEEFLRGKKQKPDVQLFQHRLMENILLLHHDLEAGTYTHEGYQAFYISDPKRRHIHKPCVRDRLLHHAIYRKLYPFFDRTFISDSFSCRVGKGAHRAMDRFNDFYLRASQNHTRTCWVLKCDVQKFFASIHHEILFQVLSEYIPDQQIGQLLNKIISSFCVSLGVGLPLGNLTSQLFVNIYMNKLDQFVKQDLGEAYYLRYADDFAFLSHSKRHLNRLLPIVQEFLWEELALRLHPRKIELRTFGSGVDFLGWVHFPDHRVLRTSTKRRMMRNISDNPNPESIQSYLGLIKHGNSYKIEQKINAINSKI